VYNTRQKKNKKNNVIETIKLERWKDTNKETRNKESKQKTHFLEDMWEVWDM
jgi:hypothetical protein